MENEIEPRVAAPGCKRLAINKWTFCNLNLTNRGRSL